MTFSEILSAFISLIENLCVLLVASYIITNTKTMKSVRKSFKDGKNILYLSLIGGCFCIYATLGAFKLDNALLNIRDVGAIIAGSLGGPIAGIAAGLIGGIHRFFLGGPTALPCALATLLSGAVSGILCVIFRKRLHKPVNGLIVGACMEIVHMLLILLISTPSEGFSAWATVRQLVIPQTIICALAVALLYVIFKKADMMSQANADIHVPAEKTAEETK